MDYQEAIEVINNHERYVGIKYVNGIEETYVTPYFEKALDTAISAMQELQELHDQGISMERLKDIDFRKRVVEYINYDAYMSMKEEVEEYKQLGTLEEIRESVKRQHVMKPILHMNEMSGMFVDYADGRGEYKTQTNNWWRCPCCNSIVGERVIIRGKSHDQRKKRFCNKCGQHIDWSNNERNE